MTILSKLINSYKTNLLTLFEQTDKNFEAVIKILTDKSFPNIEEFSQEFHHRMGMFKEKLEEDICHDEDESHTNAAEHLKGSLKKSFLATCKKNKENNVYKAKIEMHVDKYKNIYSVFQDVLFSRYQYALESGSEVDTSIIFILEWMDYGLESLSSFTYLVINNITDFLEKNSNVSLSYFEMFSDFFTYIAVNVSGIDSKLISGIFDIIDFNKKLMQYAGMCDVFEKNTLDKENESLYDFFREKMQDIKSNLRELMPRDKFEIKTMLKEMKITKEGFNDLAVIDMLHEKYEHVFIKNIFCGIKNFSIFLKKSNLCNGKKLKSISDLINNFSRAYEAGGLTLELRSFFINECCKWLSSIEVIKNKNIPHVLIKRYFKVLSVFKLMELEVPEVPLISDMMEMLDSDDRLNLNMPYLYRVLKIIVIVKLEEDLRRIEKIQSKIHEGYVNNKKIDGDLIPSFNEFEPVEKTVLGGAQPKAAGSGFYLKGEDKFFLKRTTKIENLIDDLVETLTSDICDILEFDNFARCYPVRSKTTDDVFVASACSPGFEPLKDMSGRLSSRLLPMERNFVFKFSEKQQEDLKKILFICNLIGDYDPNPGNLGKIGDDKIIKIDHGWAFDQICNKKIYTWHETMNPFRYPGRFSPTNALCDYTKLLKNLDFNFIEEILEKISDKKKMQESIKLSLEKIVEAYQGSRALGSLRDVIALKDILQSLCERFKIKYTEEIHVEYLSTRLALALYTRAHNLYFISLLEKMNALLKVEFTSGSEVKVEPTSEFIDIFEKLNIQDKRMSENRIFCGNAAVVNKMKHKIWNRLEPILYQHWNELNDLKTPCENLFKNINQHKNRNVFFHYDIGKKRPRLEKGTISPSAKRKK